jgi:hypothetical protein
MTKKIACPQCGEKVIGRTDKKFCSTQCRNSFNNKVRSESEKQIIDINRILRKNRKILQQFNPEGRTTIRKSHLMDMGFDFKYHTHTFSSSKGNLYKFCYEFGYLEIHDPLKILIINEQPYMKK